MDFSLSEEQQDVQKLAAQILAQEVTVDRLKEIEAGEERFDERLWQQLAEAGLLGTAVAETYGGMGFDFETLCLLIEEVGKTVAASAGDTGTGRRSAGAAAIWERGAVRAMAARCGQWQAVDYCRPD